MSIRRTILPVVLGALLAPAGIAAAQPSWSWPEEPKNLKVFPPEMKGERLRAPMVGFVRALGVRCSYCHVGKEGEPLSTYDFASDENPNKDRAREMIRMLGSINEHLRKIEPSETTRVNMWCHTCHRGRARPTTLEEELELADAAGGEIAANGERIRAIAAYERALELEPGDARIEAKLRELATPAPKVDGPTPGD